MIINTKQMKNIFVLILFLLPIFNSCNSQNNDSTNNNPDSVHSKNPKIIKIEAQEIAKYVDIKSIPVPQNFTRIAAEENSVCEYFRNLELKTENNIVYLYNGYEKGNQTAQFAILKIDVGTQDLQQCADAVMRLRAEYLFKQKKYSEIHFNFLSDGKPRYYTEYSAGDRSYSKYRKYMNYIFSYANTASLLKEMKPVNDINDIKPGYIFIQRGTPYGHAVTVMDVAKDNISGEKIFLLSQSYMPAQEIHILINPNNKNISPWYKINETPKLYTPEWTFDWSDLRRF